MINFHVESYIVNQLKFRCARDSREMLVNECKIPDLTYGKSGTFRTEYFQLRSILSSSHEKFSFLEL